MHNFPREWGPRNSCKPSLSPNMKLPRVAVPLYYIFKSIDLRRRNSRWRTIFGQPFMEHLGNLSVFTNENKNRRARFFLILAPFLAFFFPKPPEHGDRVMGIFQDSFGLWIGLLAATFRSGQLR